MFLGVNLVRRGVITADQLVDALERQMTCRPRLGRLALETGKLTMKQVFAVLEEQALRNMPFGETAVELGFITKRQVTNLLRKQRDLTPSVSECLIEVGAVDAETLEREITHFRSTQLTEPTCTSPDQPAGRQPLAADYADAAAW